MPTVSDIKITGNLAIDTLLEFQIKECLNQHSYLTYKGIVNDDNVNELTKSLAKKDNISVSIEGDIVFNGIPLSANLYCVNQVYTLSVSCVSHSFLLDTQCTSHSFQDTEMTHEDVVDTLFNDSCIGSVIVRDCADRKIRQPIIKYCETDWEFTKRMVSRINTVIYPNSVGSKPQIHVGTKVSNEQIDIYEDYIEGFNTNLYLKQKLFDKSLSIEDYHYIKFKTDKHFNMGQQITVNLKGNTYRLFVCKKKIELTGDLVTITHTVGSILPYIVGSKADDKLTGINLLGTVLDTKGELIKLHLDIDEYQDNDKAYWYDYKPAVGNVFHVMPQIGTTAILQLNRDSGGTGQVTHVIHQTADSQSEISDYNRRYFTTEFRKRLAMLPELLDFKNKEKNHHLELADAKGITATTTSEFKIIAQENIIMHADKTLSAYTPEKVYITKVGTDGGIEMSGGDIHIKSINSKLISRSKRAFSKNRLAPKMPAMEISSDLAKKANSMIPKCISPQGKNI